ncbi:MAG: TrkH family potassium uptake protein [Bacteroidales bacterium]|nr:TrkH family potassium uptake protein [Bacteroidales bacterium]
MNYSIVSRYIGMALFLNAVFMLISAMVSAMNGYDASFSPLMMSAIITFVCGAFPLIFVSSKYEINIKEGFVIVVFAWIFSCIFGMLPYILYGGEFSIANAWFESVSGYTTTGATILNNVEGIPKGLHFWRASTHWIGGVGVVLFMLLILPTVGSFRMKISKMEISDLSKENFRYKARQTIGIITTVYVGLTLLETILLMFAGMSLYEAIIHSFSTIATGGFSTRNLSVKSFDSFYIELIIMVFMLLSGLHFGLLFSAVSGRSKQLFKSPIVRLYVGLIFLGGFIVSLNLYFTGVYEDLSTCLRHGYFQVISCGTATGFASEDSSVWPGFSILVITYFTLSCACSGSTTGGIKIDRIWIFFKSVKAQIVRQLHPNAVVSIKVGNSALEPDIVHSVNLFIALYMFIVLAVAMLLSLMGVGLTEAISGSIANMANCGPGFGAVGSLGNYSSLPEMGKLLLGVEMLLGRLEIYPLILVLSVNRWR